ncbi:MAG: hypothetical protein JWO67_4821, partial [Streptosporangiaceae bacterium]|nr:hypothetical protein [Streptosporangiaceae bacterium]
GDGGTISSFFIAQVMRTLWEQGFDARAVYADTAAGQWIRLTRPESGTAFPTTERIGAYHPAEPADQTQSPTPRERLAAVDPDLPDLLERASEAHGFWMEEADWLGGQDRPEPGSVQRAGANAEEAAGFLDDLRRTAEGRDGGPLWGEAEVDVLADRLDAMAQDERAVLAPRVGHAYRLWTEATAAESIARLESDLAAAGPDAVSLVTAGDGSGPYVAVNRDGRIGWIEYPSGRATEGPVQTPLVSSLDLSPDGTLRDPSPGFQASGPATGYLRRLHSSLASFVRTVPDEVEPTAEPPVARSADRARVTLGKLSERRYAEVMRNAQQLVRDSTGHLPAIVDEGGRASRIDQIGLLVGAEIARSGPEVGERLAQALASELPAETRQLFRVDTRTGASELVEVSTRRGQRLGESPAGDPPSGAGPASIPAGAGGAEASGRYTYHRADPDTGVMTETHLGRDDVVVSARPASGQVHTQFAYGNGRRIPFGDPYERMPVYDTANGTWEVVTVAPKPVGSGSGTGHTVVTPPGRKLASPANETKPYQVLRRDGDGNVDLLTYERRPMNVPGPGGANSDGHKYHSLEEGGASVWQDGNPLGTPQTVDRVSAAPQGARLDGRRVENTGPSTVLVRDQNTGLYEKLTPTSSGTTSGSAGRIYYRVGSDGRLQPVTVQGQRVDVVGVSADGRTVTRTTFSPSGDGTAELYVGEDGALSPNLPQTISASDLRYDRETGQITHEWQGSAGPHGRGGVDHDAGTPGGGPGPATRTHGIDARTQTQPVTTTFTDDNAASIGEPSSRRSEGEDAEQTGLEVDDRFHGEGRTVGASSDRPDRETRAEAFGRLFDASARKGTQRTASGSGPLPEEEPPGRGGTRTGGDDGSRTVTEQVSPRSGAHRTPSTPARAGLESLTLRNGDRQADRGALANAGSSNLRPRADVERVRRRLGGLREESYAQVMAEARKIVADVSGQVPSEHDRGGPVSPVDRVRLLVANAIARFGRETGQSVARMLRDEAANGVSTLRNRDPQADRGALRSASGDPASADVEAARRSLSTVLRADYEQAMAHARVIVADVSGQVPSEHDGVGPVSPVDRVRLHVAAEIARSGREAGENLVRTLVPLTLGPDTVAAPMLVSAESLPPGMAEQWLPSTSADAYVVRGRTLADGRVLVDEPAMTPDEFGTWLGGQPGFRDGGQDRAVVLLFADAGRFASVVTARYGRPVVAPWGGFVALPSGRVMTGTAVHTQDGGVSLVATPLDAFNVHAPDGQVVPLTRELGAALDLLGVRLTAPAELPTAVTTWGDGQGLPVSELEDLAQNPDLHWLPVVTGATAPRPAGVRVAEAGQPPTPPQPEPEPTPADPPGARSRRPVYPVPEIDEHRPVSLGESTPAAPDPQRVWDDGARLPSYFHADDLGLGHGDISFRGHAEMLAGLQPLDLPQATWAEIKAALAEEAASFLGDGRPFTVAPPEEEPYEIVVQARPRGDWDRFYDLNSETIRVDKQTAQASSLTTDKTFGTSRHVSLPVPLGPGGTPGTGFGQVAIDVVGNERAYTYGYGTTGVDHREMRVSGGSHVHVDDLDFTVRTYRTGTGTRRQVGAPAQFVVRGGLRVRVPDRLTAPADTDLPRQFAFNGLIPDTYHVEQVGSVAPVFDRALKLFPGATIGSSTYRTLRQTLSPRGLTGAMGEMAADWGVLQEVPGTGQGSPAGGLRLQARLISAELLVAAEGHELRVGRVGGTRTGVTAAMSNAFQLTGMAGPLGSFRGAVARGRIQAGLTGQAAWSWRESAMSGGTASRKRLAVTSGTSGLYKVAVEYVMQRTGGAEVTVKGHVLLRLPESEARRLAAGQGVEPAVEQAAQPAVPPYLTKDHPATLGLHGVRSLTGLPSLQERSIAALARKYPNLVAPWSELDPAHPRWAGHPGRYNVVLRNTIQLSRFLSATSIAPSMDTLISTGLRLPLRAYSKFRKEYITVRLTAGLRNRRFAGSESNIGMRNSSTLTDRIDSARRILYSASLGIAGSARALDAAGLHTGSLAASWRYTWQRSRTSTFGQALSGDDQVVAAGASHSFAYDVDFHLEVAGYDRPRNAYRAGTLDLLAREHFVRTTPWTPVLDDGPATGTVTIRVPEALTSAMAKPVPAPTRPDAGIGQGADTRDWRQRGHAVVGVAGTKELNEAVQRQLAESQEESWLFTQPGTTIHEVIQDGLTADAHNANFLRMATGGWQLGPLLAKRPVQDRIGTVGVTARVDRLRAVSGLISGMELEIDRQGEMRAGHGASTAQGHGASASATFGARPTLGTTPVLGTYGPVWTIYERMRSQERSSSLTGVHDVNPVPSGRFVLVTGDVTYTVAAQGRRTGRLAPKVAVTRRDRSTEVSVPEGVYMLVQEDDARETGLLPEAPGPEPDYGRVTVPREYLSAPLGWAPENTPDASEAVALLRDWFAQKASGPLPSRYAGLLPAEELEDLAGNLKHLQSATSTLGMAGLLSQMVADGVPVRLLQGRGYLPWTNSARVSIRVQLGEPDFLRAHHNHEIDEYPNSVEGEQSSQSVSRTRGGGIAITQSPFLQHSDVHHENNMFTDAGALTRTDTRSEAKRSTGYRGTVASPRATAKLAFPTTVILSVEENGKVVHSVSAPGGPLVAQVPWTFTLPTARADAEMGAPLRALRPDAPGLDRPLELPDTAIIVNVGGVAAIRHAGMAAVAATEGAPNHRAGRTPLTQGGNVAGEVLANAVSQPVLRTCFPRLTRPGGLELPELSENFITGGATAQPTLHAQTDLGGAVLMSVSNDHRWDIAARQVRSATAGGSRSDIRSAALGAGPAVATTGPAQEAGPTYQAGMSPADRAWGESDAAGQSTQVDQAQRLLLKNMPERTFVFRFPVDWRITATGTRATWSGLAAAFARKGPLRPQTRELHVEKGVWIRLAESVARELGLITDENFPPAVSAEWDAVAAASDAWKAADKAFRDTRDDVTAAQGAVEAALWDVTEAETTLAEHPLDPAALAAATDAHVALADAQRNAPELTAAAEEAMAAARTTAEEAAAKFRDLRASAVALTTWHRTPAAARTGEEPRPLQFQDPAAPAPRLPTIPEEDESGEFGGPPEDMPP